MALLILIAAAEMTAAIFIAIVIIVSLAMATDWADGFFARRWQVTSDLGYVLDAMGDRAIHLSLTLVVLVRYQISPVFVWLLIFRDILIYAIRVMSREWLAQSRRLQCFRVCTRRCCGCGYAVTSFATAFAYLRAATAWTRLHSRCTDDSPRPDDHPLLLGNREEPAMAAGLIASRSSRYRFTKLMMAMAAGAKRSPLTASATFAA
jgi:phosphatidylglycerophosphate synthase